MRPFSHPTNVHFLVSEELKQASRGAARGSADDGHRREGSDAPLIPLKPWIDDKLREREGKARDDKDYLGAIPEEALKSE